MIGSQTIFCWDVDGVLIKYDPHDPYKDWRNRLLEENLLSHWEAFQSSPEWLACLRDCYLNTVEVLKNFLLAHGHDGDKASQIINIWLESNIVPNEETLSLLKNMRANGYRNIIISNQEGLRTRWLDRWLAQSDLGDIPRFVSCRIGEIKPDPAFYQAIQLVLSCAPQQLYLFDDKRENVESALHEGWGAQIVKPGSRFTSPLYRTI